MFCRQLLHFILNVKQPGNKIFQPKVQSQSVMQTRLWATNHLDVHAHTPISYIAPHHRYGENPEIPDPV